MAHGFGRDWRRCRTGCSLLPHAMLAAAAVVRRVSEKSPPKEAPADISPEELTTLKQWWDNELKTRCSVMASMSNEMQRRFEKTKYAADILFHLKELYGENSRHERFTTVKELMTSLMRDGTSVREHGVHMIGLVEKLAGLVLDLFLQISGRRICSADGSQYKCAAVGLVFMESAAVLAMETSKVDSPVRNQA
ncbi:hypothetical protein F511_38703 [Dorcoceras hygrometricum]|uniref:Uncharacterized protein n=1 Tax=Dorcoceras hygrometricum TaxID=472368 RepID=A0A2Z7DCD1_9LAMI|nr:hypothetical protein F511_38703 [Dorcoceras hygrometricum]